MLSKTLILIFVGGICLAAGLVWVARYWVNRTREELKSVDRSKLREWEDEDDWPSR